MKLYIRTIADIIRLPRACRINALEALLAFAAHRHEWDVPDEVELSFDSFGVDSELDYAHAWLRLADSVDAWGPPPLSEPVHPSWFLGQEAIIAQLGSVTALIRPLPELTSAPPVADSHRPPARQTADAPSPEPQPQQSPPDIGS